MQKILASIFTLGLLTLSLNSRAQDIQNYNVVDLKGGIVIQLPEMPDDPAQKIKFLTLSEHEQRSFYIKRKFLVEKLASGLTRPGLKSGIRWIKNKISAFRSSDTQTSKDETLNWLSQPNDLPDKTKAFVETTITGLVENLWANSTEIARADGLGLTFVGGAIYNTTLGKIGYVLGRSFSIDMGVDFKNQKGYIRFVHDKQALKQGGLSFDVGLMFDVLVHVTNPNLESGKTFSATHVKMPIIGCFRYGPEYKAWGAQMGVSVLEFAGAWLMVKGYPVIGAGMATATRAVGMATVYATTLDRKILKQISLSERVLRAFGLGPLLEAAKSLKQSEDATSCADQLTSA